MILFMRRPLSPECANPSITGRLFEFGAGSSPGHGWIELILRAIKMIPSVPGNLERAP